jgi:hypothetical protein
MILNRSLHMKNLFIFLLIFPQVILSQTREDSLYQTNSIHDNLPPFCDALKAQLTYPLSWLSGNFNDFSIWRTSARSHVIECLLKPSRSVPFQPIVIAEQDRGSYVAQKIVFNISAESRVLAYLLIPKGKGPFPAVLLLHDHGSKFDIGKEKVIEPFGILNEQRESAQQWVDKFYGGKFIGDELAKRGYVCFATDALNWSDRGGAEYEGQQALASNLLNLGISFSGLIAWEDMNTAEFLATRPEVDSTRVIAVGFSLGSFRAWQVAALSERIAGGIAICWMATRKGLLVPGGNLTRGQSSFTTTHSNLANYLDYPDVASLACPKPMLFYNGIQDKLFPAPSAEEAFSKMRTIWKSQHAGDNLVTKLWDTGHVFNLDMQEQAFQWLNKHFMISKK